jgi:teichuronic acid biosynthesis glycosyltransferase TuaC
VTTFKMRQTLRRLLALDLLLLVAVIAWVVAHALPSSEAVRLRNALLLAGELPADQFNWTPDRFPKDYLLETHPLPDELSVALRGLNLPSQPDNWSRATAIAQHLQSRLGSEKGPIFGDLRTTYQKITSEGAGYCGDFAMTFTALANAAGIPNRTWAFSFDGYGGHGHIFNEIWDDTAKRWRAIDIFNNYVFLDSTTNTPLSAPEFRAAMRRERPAPTIAVLNPDIRPGYKIHEKAVEYYWQGANEWYQPWGNNVVTVDEHFLVRMLSPLSRHFRSLASILAGVQPPIFVVETPESRTAFENLSGLKLKLRTAAFLAISLLFIAVLLLVIRKKFCSEQQVSTSDRQPPPESPSIVVFSTLFPSPQLPQAGIFIRERMFRVAKELPLTVVSPSPWFPFQRLIRLWKPHFRPSTPIHEVQSGIDVFRPRFLSLPGVLKNFDGILLAICSYPRLRSLKNEDRLDIIDAHFAYPDGYAAVRLGRWLDVPVSVTLRGTESRHLRDPVLAPLVSYTLTHANRIFSVAASLLDLAKQYGLSPEKATVIGNGVDSDRFYPLDQHKARAKLNLPCNGKVIVSVGGLVERKGFHRVIEQMPALLQTYPDLHYLIVGSSGPEGDFSGQLHAQVKHLGLQSRVHFLGSLTPDELNTPLSAADVFVLATRNEGWANVFLEAMACGLPVVTTNVGGNSEVVSAESLGTIVPFDDGPALASAIDSALERQWDRKAIRAYAQANSWASRISVLLGEFRSLAGVTKHGEWKNASNNEMFGHNRP